MPAGARSAVYRAQRGSHQLVVRVSGRSAAALEWELELLDALTAHGLRVPAAVRTDAGLPADRGVTVHPFLPGRPPTDVDDWRRVVDVLRSLHEITRGWPQRPGFASAADLLVGATGGDVDLAAMPEPAVQLVRRSWIPVLAAPSCVVHGDLGAGNVLVDGVWVALIDWDEARVDVPAFDYAHLPAEVSVPVAGDRESVVRAGVGWEAATCWQLEPEYARRRLAQLASLHGVPGAAPAGDG